MNQDLIQPKNKIQQSTNVHIASQEEKLDAIFGITGGKTVDDFLNDLKLETDQISATMENIDQTVKDQINQLDNSQLRLASGSSEITLELSNMEISLKSIEDMVVLSKNVLKHVADSILATPLIDSEAVQAYSKLMESIHVNINEFISIYKSKMDFVNKIKFSLFQQQQKKDLMIFKHNLEMEKIKAKDGPEIVEAENMSSREWNQEQITKMLDEYENKQISSF